ncbi:hypothetical protein LCGC14_1953550, partial [marine sediment metagenome]
MGKSLRQVRRKMNHQRSDEENILLREQLGGMQKALGNLHATMFRFAVGSNWVARLKRSHWFWKKSFEAAPLYIWVGAGNPEKAAHDIMVESFGKDYGERARAAFAAAQKEQEAHDEKINV